MDVSRVDILQPDIKVIDPRVSYTHPETAGLERPLFICDVPRIEVPIVLTNQGFKVLAFECLGCLLSGECPISAFSMQGREQIHDEITLPNGSDCGNTIPRMIAILSNHLGITLQLDLEHQPGMIDYAIQMESWPQLEQQHIPAEV